MTQVNRRQLSRAQVASKRRASGTTLAQRRARLEAQIRAQVDASMALSKSELPAVSERLKQLRSELAERRQVKEVSQYKVAAEMDVAPRTFQSWENGEVEPRGEGYGPLAVFYSGQLGREITRNWIMFGDDEAPEEPADTPDLMGELNRSDSEVLQQVADQVGQLAGTVATLEAQVQELLRRIPEQGADSAEK